MYNSCGKVIYHALSFVAAGLVAALFHAVLMSAWMYTTTAPTARHTWVAIGGRQLLDLQQTLFLLNIHIVVLCYVYPPT
jgi:hypothetical protein